MSALIGGNLNIESVQDTSHSAAHQASQSAGVSISQAGGSASYSQQKGDAHGDYAGVEEQSGIHAGAGGFDINVKGNTDLKGAYISSDAEAAKNTLTTGTLSFSDIANASNYDAKSSGFSAGGSMGAPNSAKANGVTAVSDGGGVSPMISQNDSGNEHATTKSGISAGTITVTDGTNQKQDVESLNRDTTGLNGTVSKLPDLQNLLNQQASTQQAAAIVAQTVATQIGNYADRKKREAEASGDQATADKWKEGGEYRVAMHVAGGALIGGLGGGGIGTAAQGAAGAGISAAAAGKLNELSHDIAASSPTGNADADRALGNIIANVLATGAGAVAGGATGAATASSTDLYNRQLHPDEYARAKKDAKVVAQQLGISEQEAEGRIVAEMLRNSDKQTADASGGVHDYEVRSIIGCQNLNCNGYKNDPQYANHFYNAEYIPLNQVAYTLGQSEIGRGQTYNGLVTSNVQNNPISIALAGAGMMASGVGIGGGLASLGMMGTGSAIGMLANAGVQLYNGQPFDWAGLGMAGLTGGSSSGMGFVPGLLINTGGALSSSAAAGQNPNASMAGAALGTLIGYPVGVKIEGRLNDVLNPWYRAEWRDIGMGISTSVPKSPVPSWTGGIGAGVISEISGGAVQNRVNNTK